MKKTNSTDSTVSALQSEVHHLTATMQKLIKHNSALQQRVQEQEERMAAREAQWSEERDQLSSPRTPPQPLQQRAVSATTSRQLSMETEVEPEVGNDVYADLEASSVMQGDISVLGNEGSVAMTLSVSPKASDTRFAFPLDPYPEAPILQVKSSTTSEGPYHAPVMLDTIQFSDRLPSQAKPKQHVGSDSGAKESGPVAKPLAATGSKVSGSVNEPESVDDSIVSLSLPPPSPTHDRSTDTKTAGGCFPLEVREGDGVLLLQTPTAAAAAALHTPSRVPSDGFQRTNPAPVVIGSDERGPFASATATAHSSVAVTATTPASGAASAQTPHSSTTGVVSSEALRMFESRLQQQQRQFESELAGMKGSILAEVMSQSERGFGDRIRAVESRVVQIGTLREAIMVLSEEHQALTSAHRKIEMEEKAYQSAYMTGIEQISGVVERCFEKVDEFSTETNALSTKSIAVLEGNVQALTESMRVNVCPPHTSSTMPRLYVLFGVL
jgi:hypothetical protein